MTAKSPFNGPIAGRFGRDLTEKPAKTGDNSIHSRSEPLSRVSTAQPCGATTAGSRQEALLDHVAAPPLFYMEASSGVPACYGFIPEPAGIPASLPLVVCVHGTSRAAREQIELLSPEAKSRGYALLAPHFDEESFGDYQRLGRRGRGARADLALFKARAKFEESAACSFGDMFLMGFSGGGQFAHRFAMAHPHSVAAALCTSAGWYLFPTPHTRYPRGLRVDGSLTGIRFEPEAFLRVPMLVAVGTADVGREESLRSNRYLDETQGQNRLERARSWHWAMITAAETRGLPALTEYVELNGAEHSFRDCVEHGLDRIGFDFFDAVGRGT